MKDIKAALEILLLLQFCFRALSTSTCETPDLLHAITSTWPSQLSQAQQADLKGYIVETFNACVCRSYIVLPKSITLVLPEELSLYNAIQQANPWPSTTVKVKQLSNLNLVDEVAAKLQQHDIQQADAAWIHDGLAGAVISALDGAVDLTARIQNDPSLGWSNILPFVRARAVSNGTVNSMPLDGRQPLMFYRKDLFAKYNLEIPQTWEEVVQIAYRLNGTDVDGDGVGELYGACLGKILACRSAFSIAGSYLQYLGTSQGAVFDPVTLEALTNNTGFAAAMAIFKSLVELGEPPPTNCTRSNDLFLEGRCLLTFHLGDQFKTAQMSGNSKVRGKTGVSPEPGSTKVWHREQRIMMDCTAELCPHADRITRKDGSVIYVNRAPYTGDGPWKMSVDGKAPEDVQDAAYLIASRLASPQVSTKLVLDPSTGINPFRVEHMDPDVWEEAGYDRADAVSYLGMLQTVQESSNVARSPRAAANVSDFRTAIDHCLQAYLYENKSIEVVMNETTNMLYAWMNSTASINAPAYRRAINYQAKPQMPPPAAAPISSDVTALVSQVQGAGSSSKNGLAKIIMAVVTSTCAIAGVLAYMYLLMRKHPSVRGFLRGRTPPAAGKQCTLVVSDIQESTNLWETLPAEVMQTALKLHHQTLRGLLSVHGGYESATEGDSFILAFHTSREALLYCIALQQALLQVSWPEVLLSDPRCRPLYASKPALRATASMHKDCDTESQASKFSTATFGDQERQRISVTLEGDELREKSQRTLIFRGLRVRLGLHAGLEPGNINFNEGIRRTQYAGDPLQVAKEVSDLGHGGMTLMTGAACSNLQMSKLSSKLHILYCGEQELGVQNNMHEVYMVFPKTLALRLGALDKVKPQTLTPGSLQGPIGVACIVAVRIVGEKELLAWNSAIFNQAVALLHGLTKQLQQKYGGYCFEMGGSNMGLAFQEVQSTVLWSLDLVSQALMLDWPEELLQHELAEVTEVADLAREVVLRGLRLKVGIEQGPVTCTHSAITGRLQYQGKTVSCALRMAGCATAGEVLCSGTALQNDLACLLAVDIHRKGVLDQHSSFGPVQLFRCTRKLHEGHSRSARATTLS